MFYSLNNPWYCQSFTTFLLIQKARYFSGSRRFYRAVFLLFFHFWEIRVSTIKRSVHLIHYTLRENATANPLCTRTEDQSSWIGNPSINYTANCHTSCSFIQHHSTNISSSCWWWSWSFSRALWGRPILSSSVTHSRCLYLFVIFLALCSLSNWATL